GGDSANKNRRGHTLGAIATDVAGDFAAAGRLARWPWPRRSWAMQRYPREARKNIWSSKASASSGQPWLKTTGCVSFFGLHLQERKKAAMTEPPIARGFRGSRPDGPTDRLPPGQYLTSGFPVLSAGPTPHTDLESWSFSVYDGDIALADWSWFEFEALPQ